MKETIHPQYYDSASIRCACGNTWTTGSTMPEISVEICNQCHPFYTGQEKLIDTRGRVDRFKKRVTKSQEALKANASLPPKRPRVKKKERREMVSKPLS